jgi:large subunit ribosomal protein L21
MSYAIIKTGGKQYAVEAGQTLRVPTIDQKEGETVDVETLLVSKDGTTSTEGALLKATVVSHGKADKVIVFKKKRRKQYKRKQGHRQGYTEIKIDTI